MPRIRSRDLSEYCPKAHDASERGRRDIRANDAKVTQVVLIHVKV
jgi:hypothetical protein